MRPAACYDLSGVRNGRQKHLMMIENTSSALEQERPRVRSAAFGRPRFLLIALLLSLVAHLGAALLFMVRLPIPPRGAPTPEQGTVELLMVEQKGTRADQGGKHQPSPVLSQPERKAEAGLKIQGAQSAGASSSGPPPPPVTEIVETGVPAARATPAGTQLEPAPAGPLDTTAATSQPPAKSQEAPIFDLAGTESQSNAVVLGSEILPARPDDRFQE